MVLARTQGVQAQGITTGAGHRSFHHKSALVISDPAEAREIETTYGMKGSKQVHVFEDDRLGWHQDHDRQTDGRNSPIHRYTFQMPHDLSIRRTKISEYVWVRVGQVQKRMLRSQALEESLEIVED